MSSRAKPKTRDDVEMGMRHLQWTIDLEKRKAADHHKAAQKAKKGDKKYNYVYQDRHGSGHDDDIKKREKMMKAYKKLKKKLAKARSK